MPRFVANRSWAGFGRIHSQGENNMSYKMIFLFLLVASCGFGQNSPASPSTTNLSGDELLARAKTIFVTSDTYYVKKEQLESGLINNKALVAQGIQVVESRQNADLVLTVKRAAFQNNFPFTFVDQESGTVVLGGTVNSLFGTVSGRIAGRLADRLKDISKTKQP
jgi:hypothetical protein